MANNITGVGASTHDADAFVPELWAKGIQNYISKKFVLAGLVNDISSLIAGSGDKINIPAVTENTATTTTISSFGAGTSAISYSAPNDATRSLTVDQMTYYARIYPDITEIQANPDLLKIHAEAMGYAMGKKIETYVASLYKTYSASCSELSLTTDNTLVEADLAGLIQGMYDAGADPADGYVMAVHPYVVNKLLQVDAFTSADYVTDQAIWKNGLLGSVMGMPVYVSNEFGTGTPATTENTVLGVIFRPSNVFLAYSQKPKMVSQYSVDFLGHKVASHTYYGGVVGVLKDVFQITNP